MLSVRFVTPFPDAVFFFFLLLVHSYGFVYFSEDVDIQTIVEVSYTYSLHNVFN